MIVAVLDTETTGLDANRDQIIECCVSLVGIDSMEVIDQLTQRYNPTVNIGKRAQEIHGISKEQLKDEPTIKDIWGDMYLMINESDLIVAHNVEFDHKFIQAANAESNCPMFTQKTYCTSDNGRWATWDGKRSNLGELAWVCGVEYDPSAAHSAKYDVDVTVECLLFGVKNEFFNLEE